MSLQASPEYKNKARLELEARFSNDVMKLKIPVLLLGAALLLPFGGRVVSAQNAMAKAAPAPIHPEAARELVRRVREQLAALSPSLDKWGVYYRPQFNVIEVQSNETVSMPPRVFPSSPANGFPDEKPNLEHPSFALRIEPLASPADYKRFVAKNAVTSVQLTEMEKRLRGMGIYRGKPNSDGTMRAAKSATEKQKREVAAYNRLIKSWHYLPNFYFQNISLSWVDFEGQSLFPFYDKSPAWKKEQAQVAGIVTMLVSPYDAPQK